MVERVPAHFEALDERFGRTDGDAWLERLFADGRWTEGPAYFRATTSVYAMRVNFNGVRYP